MTIAEPSLVDLSDCSHQRYISSSTGQLNITAVPVWLPGITYLPSDPKHCCVGGLSSIDPPRRQTWLFDQDEPAFHSFPGLPSELRGLIVDKYFELFSHTGRSFTRPLLGKDMAREEYSSRSFCRLNAMAIMRTSRQMRNG
jgi:hypothetical protein